MEIDSGCPVTLISEKTFDELWPKYKPQLMPACVTFRTYTKEVLKVTGQVKVQVEYKQYKASLRLFVVKGSGVSLLGREWFDPLGLELRVNSVRPTDVVAKHAELFSDTLGLYTGPPVTIEIAQDATPKFFKYRPIPFALRERVMKELDNWQSQGIIEPVRHASWASPITVVLKKDGTVRVCGDYRGTVNKAAARDVYPLPTPAEILSAMAGGKIFSVLDLAQAYQQLRVSDQTADILTINTPKGLFRVKRLPFGVHVATSVFQRVMDEVLAGLPGVRAYLDDVIIAGATEDEHSERLHTVLERLAQAGFRLKKEKCVFAAEEVKFLGYIVNAQGVRTDPSKVEAITKAPEPKTKAELQSWLGLYNFYGAFIPNRAEVLEPLHRLLDKNQHWVWQGRHRDAFQRAKTTLLQSGFLTHYEVDRPTVLSCDASPYGLGAVLSQVCDDGQERPVAFASRSLAKAEKNYAQIDREALAVLFGVKKFHQFLAGRSFVIQTDHKPLLGLLAADRPLPDTMSPRMIRWGIALAAYDYTLRYRPGNKGTNADALSRLPIDGVIEPPPDPGDILLLEQVHDELLTADDVARCTSRDPILARVRQLVQRGWPEGRVDEVLRPYSNVKASLSTHKDCLLMGSRVVVPRALRDEVLRTLHDAHPGIVQMKANARAYVWWPQLNQDIEALVSGCTTCQLTRAEPSKVRWLPWAWPKRPWSRIHIDFAGPWRGKTFLIIVDAYSKWLEVVIMGAGTTTEALIDKLRGVFATHGLPDTVVSDNGPQLTSEEFRAFLRKNGIRHKTSPPYHPATNGQAERMVQTTKNFLRRLNGDWNTRVARFLLHQHNTPNASTGQTPAELLMGRRLRTAMDRLLPDLAEVIAERQESKAQVEQNRTPLRDIQPATPVWMRQYGSDERWTPACVTQVKGPVSYQVETADGHCHQRHVYQLRGRNTEASTTQEKSKTTQVVPTPVNMSPERRDRRPQRQRRLPTHLKDFVLEGEGCRVLEQGRDNNGRISREIEGNTAAT